MATFIMANRRSGKFRETEKKAARASVDMAFATSLEPHVDVIGDNQPQNEESRRIIKFEADPAEVAATIADLSPDVIIEPQILHYPTREWLFHAAWLTFAGDAAALDAGAGTQLKVKITGGGNDLEGAEIVLYLRIPAPGTQPRKIKQMTSADGTATFNFSTIWTPAALVAVPPGGFWSMVVRGPQDGMVVDLLPLPQLGPLGWWHNVVGQTNYDSSRGQGIRVGVIDTGCGPNTALSHVVKTGAFIDGIHDPNSINDVDSHGSHVCGTIGGIPVTPDAYAGVAPGVELLAARVFPDANTGADQGDIVKAIEYLSEVSQVDLINMSLGASSPSEIERDGILDALERGTLCICAAGNTNGRVEYPGAFDEVIGVAALGLEGWAPPGTISGSRYPQEQDRYGDLNLFLSNFSCFGDEIDCAAPGVGIIAALPERFGLVEPYGGMDGTSMASPVVCGVLATILSVDPEYLALPRDITRANHARTLLRQHCKDLRLAARYQGRGVPQSP